MGGFVFCDLPDIDATTSAGRMVLTMMASVAEFEARRISERTKEALAQIGRILQRFRLSGKPLVSDQAWVAA